MTPELWPRDVLNEPSEDSQSKAKVVKKVLAVATCNENVIDAILAQHSTDSKSTPFPVMAKHVSQDKLQQKKQR